MTTIYKISNNLNGRVYIGQTKRSPYMRFQEHSRDTKSALYSDIVKFGFENFTLTILCECDDNEADNLEHLYIVAYDATNPILGYNKIDTAYYHWVSGGENPSKTDSGKKRISEYNKAHIEQITVGFVRYNESRKFPVGMLDDCGNIILVFESLSDACAYLNKPKCGTARIKNVCDKFNKNGRRSKFYGHAWTALNKGVLTNCKAEDEQPSE